MLPRAPKLKDINPQKECAIIGAFLFFYFISYNKYDDIVISPRQKEAFIRQLQTLNPQIVFKDRENP